MQAPLGYEQAALHEPRDSVSDPAYSIAEAKFADAPEEPLPGAAGAADGGRGLRPEAPASGAAVAAGASAPPESDRAIG